MILGNLYFIKNTNGLFYYAVDYLMEQKALIREIIVRPEMESAARSIFSGIPIVVCSNILDLYFRAWNCQRRKDVIYTPTPHPLPFIKRQWIVLHDAYPFVGKRRNWKRILLRLSLSMSRCMVGFINESETLRFAESLGLQSGRLIFAPNKVGRGNGLSRPARTITGPLRIGLVGTDSPKKRYDELLSNVSRSSLSSNIEFHFYGHDTPYFEGVRSRQIDVKLFLCESDLKSLPDFLEDIDLLVSVAELEGFGRPIAAALLNGIPCYLIANPVFVEFFSSANFFDNIGSLVDGLAKVITLGLAEQRPYYPPPKILIGFSNLNDQLRAAAQIFN